jgi:hypothetical protein
MCAARSAAIHCGVPKRPGSAGIHTRACACEAPDPAGPDQEIEVGLRIVEPFQRRSTSGMGYCAASPVPWSWISFLADLGHGFRENDLVRWSQHIRPEQLRGRAFVHEQDEGFMCGKGTGNGIFGVELPTPPHQVIGMMAPVAVEIIVIVFNRGHSTTVQDSISTARLTPTLSTVDGASSRNFTREATELAKQQE